VPAALVAMPEAAVHEHDGAVFFEYQVGAPRQRPRVEAVAQSRSVEEASETQLWTSVSLANPGHHARAGSGVDDVRHCGQPAAMRLRSPGTLSAGALQGRL
jgi:hypothetical protein